MAGDFRKGVWTLLIGELFAAAAVIALSPKAREAARPYLMEGIRKAVALSEEMKGMLEEARVEASQIARAIGADRPGKESH